jgi:hypothetical protein
MIAFQEDLTYGENLYDERRGESGDAPACRAARRRNRWLHE